eukprot:768465-Hanusia_phi.AAC.3
MFLSCTPEHLQSGGEPSCFGGKPYIVHADKCPLLCCFRLCVSKSRRTSCDLTLVSSTTQAWNESNSHPRDTVGCTDRADLGGKVSSFPYCPRSTVHHALSTSQMTLSLTYTRAFLAAHAAVGVCPKDQLLIPSKPAHLIHVFTHLHWVVTIVRTSICNGQKCTGEHHQRQNNPDDPCQQEDDQA